MNASSFVSIVLNTHPRILAAKAVRRLSRQMSNLGRRAIDARVTSRASSWPTGPLQRYFPAFPVELLAPHADKIAELSSSYLDHCFDLLGSGWTRVAHGIRCRGLEGHIYNAGPSATIDAEGKWLDSRINQANLDECRRVWRMVDRDYEPIDWHLDFKSGYRWSEKAWYLDIPHSHLPGVDIKVPWELARCQHLSCLAHAFSLSRSGTNGFRQPDIYLREFRNQVLDFIATNPPRFGVNWACAMDVGIRVANWLVAYDLFRARGGEFDPDFESEFARSVYEHGLHLISNLEWSAQLRSNHYLADITGLLFVAAYLPRSPETDTWLAFAVRELVSETQSQFHAEGSNFEGSTSYHRLSAEMVCYGTALTLALSDQKKEALSHYDHRLHRGVALLDPAPVPLYETSGGRTTPFPASHFDRLRGMAAFTMSVTRPDGYITQIGDNDSGRFLKLTPFFERITIDCTSCLEENSLDHRHLVGALNAFFEDEKAAEFARGFELETQLVKSLVGDFRWNGKLSFPTEEPLALTCALSFDRAPDDMLDIPATGCSLTEGLQVSAFRDFGLYVFRSKSLYLTVRCGSFGQNGNAGHAHNDQLSVELFIEGRQIFVDPGTYLYTPCPELRNRYRSALAHVRPVYEHDPDGRRLRSSLFHMPDATPGQCLALTSRSILCAHDGIALLVEINENSVRLSATGKSGKVRFNTQSPPFSPGYGKLIH